MEVDPGILTFLLKRENIIFWCMISTNVTSTPAYIPQISVRSLCPEKIKLWIFFRTPLWEFAWPGQIVLKASFPIFIGNMKQTVDDLECIYGGNQMI